MSQQYTVTAIAGRRCREALTPASCRSLGGCAWFQLTAFLVPLALAGGCDFGLGPEIAKAQYRAAAGTVLKIDPALERIIPQDYRIEKLAAGFSFAEGPVWVTGEPSYLLFTDVRRNIIYQWTIEGMLRELVKPALQGWTGPTGLTLDPEGRLVICEHGNRRISRIERDGRRTVLVERYAGRRLNSPNDAVYRSDGSLYFTDPPYGLRQQDHDPAKELDFNGVFRLSSDGRVEVLSKALTRPNGIAFAPDERTLYVSNSDPERRVLVAFPVRADGRLADPEPFYDFSAATAGGSPDGMKVDREGNVYTAGPGGVWVFNSRGQHLGTIQPDAQATSVAWGEGGSVLYITADTGLYRIRLLAQGTP
jgi:gluconolactonase